MSKYAAVSLHIGWNGENVWLGDGSEWPDNHPIVLAYPDYFTDTPPGEPPKPRRGRPPKVEPKTELKVEAKPAPKPADD